MVQKSLLGWYASNKRDLPWRRTRDPYAILVSEFMLQQTQVERVVPRYEQFLLKFPDFSSLASANVGEVIRSWSGLGYNIRAVRLWRLANEVITRYGGVLPKDPVVLRALSGVGEYTAAAVACFAFDGSDPVIDTNVRRVLGRLRWGFGKVGPGDLRLLAEALTPQGDRADWAQGLMDLGASICVSRRPRCGICPLKEQCLVNSLALTEPPVGQEPTGGKKKAFKDSNRYYRGRLLERLRKLNEGQAIRLYELGAEIRERFSGQDLAWLGALVDALEQDGLVTTEKKKGSEDLVVRLP